MKKDEYIKTVEQNIPRYFITDVSSYRERRPDEDYKNKVYGNERYTRIP